MSNLNLEPDVAAESDLERVIEPLASYICGTARPKAALRSALAYLVSEVEATTRLANSYVGILSEGR